MRPFYAHSLEGQPPNTWETIEAHAYDVATLASGFSSRFEASDWGRILGLWHDLGKYSVEFQKRILGANGIEAHLESRGGTVDHSTAGAKHAGAQFPGIAGRLLAYCIAGHHGGLPDDTDEDGGSSGLKDRLKKPICDWSAAPEWLTNQSPPPNPPMIWSDRSVVRSFQCAVFCRMLFSCLIDADSLATEAFVRPDEARKRPGPPVNLEELSATLDRHLKQLQSSADETAVNSARAAVLAQCRSASARAPGLFSLTVPTGGGKTLSSLAFALRHAVKHGLRRVIYAIPFTSIIEQNAKVFRDALEAAGDNVVLEHHSNFEGSRRVQNGDDIEACVWGRLATENWDAPIVVTTNVQLFESLFANRKPRCRKLHRIAGSVIILDEVQTLPVALLKPTLAMLDELCRNYGCSVVLCSATQPAIEQRPGFPIGLSGVREIMDDPPRLFSKLERVTVERIGEIEDSELAARLNAHGKPPQFCDLWRIHCFRGS